MTMSFDTSMLAKKNFGAACHPFDKQRPQLVSKNIIQNIMNL